MIVVVGSSTLAGSHARVPYRYAHEDPEYGYTRNAPHPLNLQHSFGKKLADTVKEPFMIGAQCSSEVEVLDEIRSVTRAYPDRPLFFIAEAFVEAQRSRVHRSAGREFTGLAVGVQHSTLVPAFATVAAGHESFTSAEDFDDTGHRLFASVLLQYIIEHYKEHFNL